MKAKILIVSLFSVLLLILGCGRKQTKTPQGYWDSAVALFDTGNYEGAVEQYRNLAETYPQDSLAIKAMFAAAEIKKNNLDEQHDAIKIYQQIIKKYPDSPKTPNAKFMIGYIYANDLQDFDKAREHYQEFIRSYPDHMLVQSAKWEMDNLGKSLDEIPQLKGISD